VEEEEELGLGLAGFARVVVDVLEPVDDFEEAALEFVDSEAVVVVLGCEGFKVVVVVVDPELVLPSGSESAAADAPPLAGDESSSDCCLRLEPLRSSFLKFMVPLERKLIADSEIKIKRVMGNEMLPGQRQVNEDGYRQALSKKRN
jgi:hypothetical protein